MAHAGIEVDQVAVNRKGRRIYFEFKGGYDKDRPGLIRTDTTKKVLCNAFLLHYCHLKPFIVITSFLPKVGRRSDRMIKWATEQISDIIFDIIKWGDEDGRKRLRDLLDMDDFSKPRLLLPVPKLEKYQAPERELPYLDLTNAVQIARPFEPKHIDQGKKIRRKVSAKKNREPAGKQLQLFDEE